MLFPITCLCAPVQDGVKACEEEHVNHENARDPDDQNDHDLDHGQIASLITAFAPRAKRLSFRIRDVDVWKYNMRAVTVLGADRRVDVNATVVADSLVFDINGGYVWTFADTTFVLMNSSLTFGTACFNNEKNSC